MTLEKGDPGSLEEWETVVGDDFSLYYDSYSVDERVDSDSKVRGSRPRSQPFCPRIQGSLSSLSCPSFSSLSFSEHPLVSLPRTIYNLFPVCALPHTIPLSLSSDNHHPGLGI